MVHRGYNLISILLVVVVGLATAKFPDDPKPCKYDDTACIGKLVRYFLTEKNQGDSSINLIKVDPLAVSKISIKQGAENPVNIDLTFNDNAIYGLSTLKEVNVKGFGKDLTKKHEISLKCPSVSLVGDYTINGRVLILPINGNGKNNITLSGLEIVMRFAGVPEERNGETYMKIDHLKLKLEPELLHFQFGNLFNGDKALGDNMNLFLNENWKDIYSEVRVSISDAFSQIFQSVINNVFTKYPYDKFFTE